MFPHTASWTTYRTRFLVKARQLDVPLTFTDALGREHRGQKGDYLVESSDGLLRIAPREIFEDIYVPMDSTLPPSPVAADSLRSLRRTDTTHDRGRALL
jgi:hypothetical protein